MFDQAASSGIGCYRNGVGRSLQRIPLVAALVGIGGLAVTGAARAQDEKPPETEVRLGSRIPWRIERPTASQREGTRVLFRFASCTVEEKFADSLALLQLEPTAAQHDEILSRIIGKYNACLRGAERMGLSLIPFRGAIANALYLQHYPSFPADRLRPSPATAGRMLTGDAANLMSDFARCVVMTDPAAVDALLRTRPASDGEHEALQALSVHFSACLYQGQNLAMNALALRSVLAEAAYRLSIGAESLPAMEH